MGQSLQPPQASGTGTKRQATEPPDPLPSLSRTEIQCLPRAKARRYLKMMKEVQYGDVAVVRSRLTGVFIANAIEIYEPGMVLKNP